MRIYVVLSQLSALAIPTQSLPTSRYLYMIGEHEKQEAILLLKVPIENKMDVRVADVEEEEGEIGTILCAERWCC